MKTVGEAAWEAYCRALGGGGGSFATLSDEARVAWEAAGNEAVYVWCSGDVSAEVPVTEDDPSFIAEVTKEPASNVTTIVLDGFCKHPLPDGTPDLVSRADVLAFINQRQNEPSYECPYCEDINFNCIVSQLKEDVKGLKPRRL